MIPNVTTRFEEWAKFQRTAGQALTPDSVYYTLRNFGVPRESVLGVLRELVRRGAFPLPRIRHLELFLTEACNLGCTYCFVEGKNTKNRMTWETARRSVDYVFEQAGPRVPVSIVFFGGEPLLEWDLIRRVVSYADDLAANEETQRQVKYDITTNGTLLDEERARWLAEHRVRVLLSIDGDEDVHDTYRRTLGNAPTYRKVMKAAELVHRYQGHIGAKITTMPEFAERLDRDVRALTDAGVRYFLIGYASGTPWSIESADAYGASLRRLYEWWRRLPGAERPGLSVLEDVLEKDTSAGQRHNYGCRAGRTAITVNCREEIYACSKMLGADGLTGILPLGTLDEGITEFETRLTLCGVLPVDRPGCWSCQMQDVCHGGCYAVNHSTTGDPFKSGPECKMVTAQQSFEKYVRRREQEGYARTSISSPGFCTIQR